MKPEEKEKLVEALIDKASASEAPNDALLFSQAALNAANALAALKNEGR